jgi:hypothetical protein
MHVLLAILLVGATSVDSGAVCSPDDEATFATADSCATEDVEPEPTRLDGLLADERYIA